MNAQFKKIDDSTFELSVELGKEELVGYIRNTERRFGQELMIDGFRKGKAPQELVEKNLDKAQVLQAALQDALQTSLARAIEERDLDVLQTRDLKIHENSADKLRYTVVVTVFPSFDLPDLGAYKADRQPQTVQDKELEDAIDTIRNWKATFVAKEGTAQAGDRVEVDFKVSENGKLLKGGESQSHPLIIGGKSFMPGFEDQLIGMKKDEEKSFSLVAPDDYYQKDVAGKKLDFGVKMKLIQNVKLPELDDNFIKGLGKFSDVAQFKDNVRQGILQEKEEKERQRVRLEVLDRIIATAKINPPEQLIREHLDRMVSEFDADLHAKGMELGIYLAHVGKTQEELRLDWKKDAEKQAKIELILRTVAKKEKIQISENEVDAALSQMVQALVSRGQADPSQLNLQEMRNHISDRLLNEKALELIESKHAA